MNINVHQLTGPYINQIATEVAALVQYGLNRTGSTPYRYAVSDIVGRDPNVKNSLISNLLNYLECYALDGTVNLNDYNQFRSAIASFYNQFIPYCCCFVILQNGQMTQYYGLHTIPPQERNNLQNDGNKTHNMFTNMYNRLVNHYSNLNNNQYNQFNTAFNNGAPPMTMTFQNNNGNPNPTMFAGGNFSAPQQPPQGHFSTNQPHQVEDYYAAIRRRKEEEAKQQQMQQPNNGYPNGTFVEEDMFIETDNFKAEQMRKRIAQEAETMKQQMGLGQQQPLNPSPAQQQNPAVTRNNFTPEQMNTQVHQRRKRGTNWFIYTATLSDPICGNIEVKCDMLRNPDNFLAWRKIHAPSELYPVQASDLIWVNQEAFIDHTYEDGQTIRERIYVNNQANPCWKTWDASKYTCQIVLNENFMPVQEFIELPEEVKMNIDAHRIPNTLPNEVINIGVMSSHVPYNGVKPTPFESELANSLIMSEEQIKEQESILLARGEQLDDFTVTVLDKESAVENLDDIKARFVADVMKINPNSKVGIGTYFVVNETYTKEPQKELINLVHDCADLETLKDKVFDKIWARGEYTLYNAMSKLLDKEYNKVLVRTGITDTEVNNVITCFKDAIDYNIIPEDLRGTYHANISHMIRNLFAEDCDDFYPEDEYGRTYMGHRSTFCYIDRFVHDLSLKEPDEAIQLQGWVEITAKSVAPDFFEICRNLMIKQSRVDSNLGRSIHIVTKEGEVFEIMVKNFLTYDSIYLKYTDIKK